MLSANKSNATPSDCKRKCHCWFYRATAMQARCCTRNQDMLLFFLYLDSVGGEIFVDSDCPDAGEESPAGVDSVCPDVDRESPAVGPETPEGLFLGFGTGLVLFEADWLDVFKLSQLLVLVELIIVLLSLALSRVSLSCCGRVVIKEEFLISSSSSSISSSSSSSSSSSPNGFRVES